MRPPRVSIVVPVYNGANYMRLAIDSALAQDYPDVEVLVVNDGSRDDGATDAIARSYGSRIRYLAKANGGVASALNAGIAAMTGEIFCWLSHDDIHLPHKTSRQVAEWDRLGRPDAVMISDYRLIDAAGARLGEVRFDHGMLTAKPLYALLRGSIHGCSVFLPRRLFDLVGTFDESLPTTQDYDLWHRMIRRFSFLHLPEILIESRWHDEQGSKRMDHRLEASSLWIRLIDGVTDAECAALEGGRVRFLRGMSDFLGQNGLTDPQAHADAMAGRTLDATMVSVVLPVSDRVVMAVGALETALAQTHPTMEVIVVAQGDAEDWTPLRMAVARHAPRARLIHQETPGLAAARNRGWREAEGRYVAFLDVDGLFCEGKIASQLRFNEEGGFALSNTGCLQGAPLSDGLRRVGCTLGPDVAEPVGTLSGSTLMVRTELRDEGLAFDESSQTEGCLDLWRRVSRRYATAGLQRALTVVRASAAPKGPARAGNLQGVPELAAGGGDRHPRCRTSRDVQNGR